MNMKTQKNKRRTATKRVKICRFCENKVNYIDFLDANQLSRFQTEKGKILPRRITGTCLYHQKQLSKAIKRARVLSLVL